MKRYKQDYRGDFYEHAEGPWVKYEDAHAAVLEAENSALRTALREREG